MRNQCFQCRRFFMNTLFAILFACSMTTLHAHAGQMRKPQNSLPTYPLKLSANKRYLVNRDNKPFLIAADSPQGLISSLTTAQANGYFADRAAHGFNALGWIDVLNAGPDFPFNPNAATVDGIRPFTGYVKGGTDHEHYDLSKPNEAYFQRLDTIVKLAAEHGLLVFIDPIETKGWLPTLRNNGLAAAFHYGQFLGRRYGKFANVAWLSGNDYITWKNPSDDALVRAVARGIKSVDPSQLQSVELNYQNSSSLDDQTWAPLISLNGTYAYSPTYMQMLHSYDQKPIMPTYLLEAHYDLENVGEPPDYGTPLVLRREEYWAMLCGGAGVFYGNHYTWSFDPGWQAYIDTLGVKQLTIWKNFFTSLPWQRLVPDQSHKIVVAGLGNYGTWTTRVSRSTYATAAATPDGRLVVAYLPTSRTLTVNMARLSGPVTGRWFDPTDGASSRIAGGAFPNNGMRKFSPPGKNHGGDGDWVLVLRATRSTANQSQGLASVTPNPMR